MADSTSEISLHFLDYWRVIRNRGPIILTVFLMTFIGGYITSAFFMDKLYSSMAQVKLQKKQKDIKVFVPSAEDAFDPIFFQAEVEVIQSKKILYPVIDKLNLNEVWGRRLFKMDRPLQEYQTYSLLNGRYLDVTFKRGSNLIEIKGISDVPNEAALIANTVVEIYAQERRGDEKAKSTRGFETLDEEISKQQKIVTAARDKVEKLRKDLNIDAVNSGSDVQMIEVEWQHKSTMLDDAKADALARQIRYDELKKLDTAQLVDALAAMGMEDTNLSSLRTRELAGESDLQLMLKSGLESNHPRVQARKAELEKVKEQIVGIVEGKRRALSIDVQVSQARLQQLTKEVDDLANKVRASQGTVMAPYREAQREFERQQNVQDALIVRKKQEYVESAVIDDPVTIVSKAEPADRPYRPNMTLNLAASAAVGLALGIFLAFFIEYLDTSVKTLEDVEKYLGLPVLAVIPEGVKALNQEDEDSPHAEGYRILRAKIDLTTKRESGASITVLSGGPGEGKSTTLFNLAYVCAGADLKVLMIDADVRRPALHNILGIENNVGLADVMLGKKKALDVIFSTDIPNLNIMTSGDLPTNEMGSFSGRKIREILDEMKNYYDVVFIDSPPILGISDGSIIAHEVDSVLLVIQHRRFPRDISLRAKRSIEEVKGNLIGVVLNAVEIKTDDAYYYYSSYGDYYYKDKTSKRGTGRRSSSGTAPEVKSDKNEGTPNGSGSEHY